MSVYARTTYTVQRHLEGSILLNWVIWHVAFFFACRAQDYTFCLLIVRYMLSDKIKGKSALKARTFLRERDKIHVHYMVEAVYASIDGKQSRLKYFLKPFIGEMFTYKKHSIHRNSSAMVINFNMVTDINQTCLGQGLGVTLPRENVHVSLCSP